MELCSGSDSQIQCYIAFQLFERNWMSKVMSLMPEMCVGREAGSPFLQNSC